MLMNNDDEYELNGFSPGDEDGGSVAEYNPYADFMSDEEESKEKTVKRKNIEMKPMDEEEAILEMELLGHSFFVYKDMDTNKVCV